MSDLPMRTAVPTEGKEWQTQTHTLAIAPSVQASPVSLQKHTPQHSIQTGPPQSLADQKCVHTQPFSRLRMFTENIS